MEVLDEVANTSELIPVRGHVAATTDMARGVSKCRKGPSDLTDVDAQEVESRSR